MDTRAGLSFFVKAATTEPTAVFLRDEHAIYSGIAATCMPEMLAWDDAGKWPILVLEDLSGAAWPPPWNPMRIDAVLRACAELASIEGPDWLPSWRELRDDFMRWRVIGEDPRPFLSTGLANHDWLETALPLLCAAEAAADVTGTSVVHSDVRSDNLCFVPEAKLVDWNWTHRATLRSMSWRGSQVCIWRVARRPGRCCLMPMSTWWRWSPGTSPATRACRYRRT